MNSRPKNIFNEGPCLTAEELKAYAEGRLDGAEAHRAEKHLLECAFCTEALEGISESGNAGHLSQITEQLNKRIDTSVKPFAGRSARYSFRRIAAVVVLLIAAGSLWMYIGRMNSDEKLFSQYYEPFRQSKDSIAKQEDKAVVLTQPPAVEMKKAQEPPAPLAANTKKALKEDKTRKAEPSKDLILTDQTSTEAVATAPVEEKTIQADVVKRKDEAVAVESERNGSTIYASPGKEKAAPAPSKNTESLSKQTTGTAFSAQRETERPEMHADAYQNQRALIDLAIQQYSEGNYNEAFQNAEKYLKKYPKDPEGLFFSGVSALSIKKEKVAARRLEGCLATGAQPWKEDASWYLALCYVKLGKSADAKPYLEYLGSGNGPHAAEARKMLESIH